MWSADAVEMFLGRLELRIESHRKRPEVFCYWGVDTGGQEVVGNVPLGIQRDGVHITYEAAFPAAAVAPLEFASGNTFRFNMLMNDLDPSGPENGRHWLQLVPEKPKQGGPKPNMQFVLE